MDRTGREGKQASWCSEELNLTSLSIGMALTLSLRVGTQAHHSTHYDP